MSLVLLSDCCCC